MQQGKTKQSIKTIQDLLAEANELQRAGKFWASRIPLQKAIGRLEKEAPESDELATVGARHDLSLRDSRQKK